MSQPAPAVVTLLLAALVPVSAAAQGGSTIETGRIFQALGLRTGATVCEIGAGDGTLSLAAASRVGTHGHVYTSELGDERLQALRTKVAGHANVEVIAAGADRTNFPDESCDALFMRNVYHHIAAPGPMSASLAAALKPSGRIAIVDFAPPGAEAPMPSDRDEETTHGVTADSVRRELADAGFRITTTETGPGRSFMVVAIRPGS